MIILGVTHPISWNNGACLLKDGKLVAMIEEERINRFKHSPRVAPTRSIEYCLKEGGVSLDKVDAIGVGWHPESSGLLSGFGKKDHVYQHYLNQLPFSRNDKRIELINHHISHALSSYYASDFDSANVVSLDASGGSESGILGIGQGADFEVIHKITTDSSWGIMYGSITDSLGFIAHSDEGKVMGLAAYGEPNLDEFDFIDWDQEVPLIHRDRLKNYVAKLTKRQPHEPLTEKHKNLAATVQVALQQGGLRMTQYLHQKNGIRNVCTAGGCSLNCSMNGYLLRQDHIDSIFIQPAAHDVSTALGAAVKVHHNRTGERPEVGFTHAYWGPQFSNEQIEHVIKEARITNYKKSSNIEKEVAQLLAEDNVVGWFQGRMEVGPRALGGRSILASPIKPENKDIVNAQVKHREGWRPFAPSFLKEDFEPYVTHPHESPFMIIAFIGQEGKIDEIPAASHVDKTIRVQTIDKKTNEPYWNLVNEFKKITGVPALLNTSFNVAGQPIVCTPFDAIGTFYGCGMNYLAIGDFLLWK